VEQIKWGENFGKAWIYVFAWFSAKITFMDVRARASNAGTPVKGWLCASESPQEISETAHPPLVFQRQLLQFIELISQPVIYSAVRHERIWMDDRISAIL
jgi:hypothetical protein